MKNTLRIFGALLAILLCSGAAIPATGPTPGFLNIGNVTATTFVDSTNCKPNFNCAYEVTAVNAAGESAPDGPVIVSWGATSKSTTLNWNASTGAVSYNVYFLAAPAAPTGLSGAVN